MSVQGPLSITFHEEYKQLLSDLQEQEKCYPDNRESVSAGKYILAYFSLIAIFEWCMIDIIDRIKYF